MTKKEITTATEILKEENLLSLGFKNIGKTCDKFEGTGYQYKEFKYIRILNFMGIRTLELYFPACSFVDDDDLRKQGLTDVHTQYCIYDKTNEDDVVHIDIHSNEELVAICEKWASAIKAAGIKKAEQLKEYYKNL